MTQFIDGRQIEVTRGRFSGTFDIEGRDADYLGLASDGAVLIVVVKPSGAAIDETVSGQVRRVDKLVVKDAAVVRSTVLRKQLTDTFALELPSSVTPTPVERHVPEEDTELELRTRAS